jgi:hypothetical protein
MKAFGHFSAVVFGFGLSNLCLGAEGILIYFERPATTVEWVQRLSDKEATPAPAGQTDWSSGVPRIDGGLTPAFSERFAMTYRRPISDGVSLVSTTGLA